jgi:hypothetical protein
MEKIEKYEKENMEIHGKKGNFGNTWGKKESSPLLPSSSHSSTLPSSFLPTPPPSPLLPYHPYPYSPFSPIPPGFLIPFQNFNFHSRFPFSFWHF